MPHDVFISYSADDKATADAVCAKLEERAIRCWMAPRDIQPGRDWASAIVDAIGGARLMVVVFSGCANRSKQVMREVERAVTAGQPILPFRIEEVPYSKTLGYFLGTCHWLDALTPPIEVHIKALGDLVLRILSSSESLDDVHGQTHSQADAQLAADLFSEIFWSRLPDDLEQYCLCKAESDSGTTIWRSPIPVKSLHSPGDGYGRISIEPNGPKVQIEDYSTRGLYRRHRVTYRTNTYVPHLPEAIEVYDRTTVLEFGGKTRDTGKFLAASPALWSEVVQFLRMHIERNIGGA
jgi:hypothetical protein